MDTPTRRDFSFPTDQKGAFAPRTSARLRLTRRGIGGQFALLGNPVSVTVDPVLGCLPWISLRGGTDPKSNQVRQGVLEGDESPGGTAYTQTGASADSPAASGLSRRWWAGGRGNPSPTASAPSASFDAGPFAYIKIARPGG